MFDVIIAGGGPAGLQAALVLGRARRRVLLCDAGEPRNTVTGVIHGFLTRDGLDPAELRRIAAAELGRYPTVELRTAAITSARPANDRFTATLTGGVEEAADRLILATGVVDELPALPGLDRLWGRAAFHCPYCDGFERSDQPLAVIDAGAGTGFYALQLSRWSPDVVLCTNGPADLPEEDRTRLSARGITVREEPIARRAIFVRPPTRQRSDLAAQLGCEALEDGSIEVDDLGRTSVAGVYAAGDMARRPGLPFPAAQVLHAASGGGVAAVAADRELLMAEIDGA